MQLMLNLGAIFFRILSNSFSNVFQKKLACEGDNPVYINYVNYLILSLFCIPFLFFIDYKNLSLEFWLYAILDGLSGAFANSFMVMALEHGDLSVLGPINSYKSVIGLLAGIILLHEIPNIFGLTGIALIIFGSYFIFDTLEEKFSLKVFTRKDIQYRIYALILSAIEAVFIKKVIILSSIKTSFIASCISGAIFSYFVLKLFKIKFRKECKKISKKNLAFYISTAFCFGIMTYTTAYVFKHMNVGYALSLFQLSIILNLFLGYKLFRETDIKKKLAGSIIILAGSTMIILFGH